MNISEIKKSDIELVYVYFDKMNDENDGACIDHFAMNLSPNFKFTYDYNNHSISLETSPGVYSKGFWSIDDSLNNISNVSLLLGENGIGKTTLLRLICARATENIEHTTDQKYILIYYIKNEDLFFVKTTCLELLEIKDSDVSEKNKCASILYRGTKKNQPATGYCGLVSKNINGKLMTYGPIKFVQRLEDLKSSFCEMLPMECIYLPLPSDTNSSIYLSRKGLLHSKQDTRIVDVLNFLLLDYENAEYHFISKYPKFIIDASSSHQAQNEEYSTILFRLYEKLQLGESYTTAHLRNKFLLNYKSLIRERQDSKCVFFINVLLSFMARIVLEKKGLYEPVLAALEKYKLGYPNDTGQERYKFLCKIVCDLLLQEKAQVNCFKKVVQELDELPNEIFQDATIDGNPLKRVFCSLSLASICTYGKEKFIGFIKATQELENSLNSDNVHFYFTGYRFSEMSTGEYSLIKDVFARMFSLIEEINICQKKKSILIVMDEPDATLHLRWTQSFIYSLIQILAVRYPQYVFQIILSSHMPFLVTDFPRSNVFCLCSKEWRESNGPADVQWSDNYAEDISRTRAFHPKNGFMCNYYDILRDAFLIDVPVGKFAQAKYEQINRKISCNKAEFSEEDIMSLYQDVNVIDEPVLKKVLKDKLGAYMDKRTYIKELRNKANELLSEANEIERELTQDDQD